MRIKFLHTVPSERPGYPFQPGQIIDLPTLTDVARAWIAAGVAVPMPDAPEVATLAEMPEVAVLGSGKRRGRR